MSIKDVSSINGEVVIQLGLNNLLHVTGGQQGPPTHPTTGGAGNLFGSVGGTGHRPHKEDYDNYFNFIELQVNKYLD